MIKILEKLLNLLYIKVCYFCKSQKEDRLICSNCKNKIRYLPVSVYRKFNNTDIYACSLYDGIIKKLIIDFKYKKQKQLANIMAELLYDYWKKINKCENFVVIPVPIHKSRLKERKYNHMEITAKYFCDLTEYKYNVNFIKRIKETTKQYKLNKNERMKNIKDAFELNHINMPDKQPPLLILDDITSTGATFNEIIKLLNENGYNNITAFALSTPEF